jgi:hypothetical protein
MFYLPLLVKITLTVYKRDVYIYGYDATIFWNVMSCDLIDVYRRSSETSVNIYQITQRHITGDTNL